MLRARSVSQPIVAALVAVPLSSSADSWNTLLDAPPSGLGIDGSVYAMIEYGDGFAVGGDFTMAGSESIRSIAVWAGGSWRDLGDAGGGSSPAVFDLMMYGDLLVAAGEFTSIGGVSANGIAAWDGTTWSAFGSGLTGGSPTQGLALATYGGDLIVGGFFSSAGGVAVGNIARWDGAVWSSIGSVTGDVLALLPWDGDLIVGGGFGTDLRRWDGTSWSFLGTLLDNGFEPTIWSLAELAGDLVVGGTFDEVNGQPIEGIVRFDGIDWHAMGDGLEGGFGPVGLTSDGTELLAAGTFTGSGGTSLDGLARWDGVAWAEEASVSGLPWHVVVRGGDLFVGGQFSSVDGVASQGLAWRSPLPFWTDVTNAAVASQDRSVAVSAGDYDGDGDADVYLSGGGATPNQLLRNDAGTFVDATVAPLDDGLFSWGSLWVDLDDDGDLDLYVSNAGTNHYFRNDGATFVDATVAPLDDPSETVGTAAADYDGDGDVDLFLANHDADNRLLRNDGGTFVDATPAIMNTIVEGYRAAWTDVDLDGDPDLYLTNELSPNQLFRNDGGTFVDVTTPPLDDVGSGDGIAWGDPDGDGDLDLALANVVLASTTVLRNDGGGAFAAYPGFGTTLSAVSPAWADFDLDGDADLAISGYDERNAIYRNDGGTFVDLSRFPLDDPDQSESIVPIDYDGDGDLDLFQASYGDVNRLFRNDESPGNHWLQVDLVGVLSNHFGVGARLELTAGGVMQVGEVRADTGAHGQSPYTVSFGLGSATTVDLLRVRWPSGLVQDLTPSVDQRIVVTEAMEVTDWTDATAAPIDDASSARGVAWGDTDGDGDADLYVTNLSSSNLLFRNDGGSFVDVTSGPAGDAGEGSGTTLADYDNDGDLDLYLVNFNEPSKLLRNDGSHVFADVTVAPLDDSGPSRFAPWGDYDDDGYVDLYVLRTGANLLLRNDAGTFSDVTAGPIGDTRSARGGAWGDYDDDGDLDFYVGNNSTSTNVLLRNDGGGSFADATGGPLDDTDGTRGVSWIDYDNDGDLDLHVVNSLAADRLFRNDGYGIFRDVTAGLLQGTMGNGNRGGVWLDFDNDGDLDVLLLDASDSQLFENEGGGVFVPVQMGSIAFSGVPVAAAVSDYDLDGDVDVYVGSIGANQLLRNDTDTGAHWLQVSLEGVTSNRAAIGARVELTAGGVTQTRMVSAGEGYLAQNDLVAHFGLGANTTIDEVRVRWPSGAISVETPTVDQRIALVEPPAVMTFGPDSLEAELPEGFVSALALELENAPDSPPLGWAVAVDAACPWISVSPPAGTIVGGDSETLTVTLDAAGVTTGVYECPLTITSSDPMQPEVAVPLTVTVGDVVGPAPIDGAIATRSTAIGVELVVVDFASIPRLGGEIADPIGHTGVPGYLPGLAIDPTGAIFASSNANDHLYRLDGESGASMDLGSLGTGSPLGSLAFDDTGTLWGVGITGGTLYQVDPVTLVVTVPFEGLMYLATGLVYDPALDRLLSVAALTSTYVFEIDRETGAFTLIAQFSTEIVDLAAASDGTIYGVDGVGFYEVNVVGEYTTFLGYLHGGVGLASWPVVLASSDPPTLAPVVAAVRPAAPNPLRGTTWIGLELPVAGRVTVDLYDAGGRFVRTLSRAHHAAGTHRIRVDGHGLSSGLYFYQVTVPGLRSTHKLTVLR